MKFNFHNGDLAYKKGVSIVGSSLHKVNRRKICDRLRDLCKVPPNAIILVQGGKRRFRYSSDTEEVFRQESYFHWLFGVKEHDCLGIIEVDSGKTTLFFPNTGVEDEIWMGKAPSNCDFKKMYQVDFVFSNDKLGEICASKKPALILTLESLKKHSHLAVQEAYFEGINSFHVDRTTLIKEIDECRVKKSKEEIDVMRYACKVACNAHIEVMKRMRPGMKEYQVESMLQHCAYGRGGCRLKSYILTVASGPNAAIMCYGNARLPNDRTIQEGDICLVDSGFEYHCYSSDVTCTFPASGKFSSKQKIVYNAVLKANQDVFNLVKPGISWVDLHLLGGRTILEEFKAHGLIQGDIDKMMDLALFSIFMPFAVGHFVGIDLVDVTGYPEERRNEPGLDCLFSYRTLEEGMVITVEPGVYFISSVIEKALIDPKYSPFLNEEILREYMDFGGVRVEDCVAVTSTGGELLTPLPRTVDEIEKVMAEGRIVPLEPII